jgi:hypothetical protein
MIFWLRGRNQKIMTNLGLLIILYQSVARDARHTLVRVSAAQRAAETR